MALASGFKPALERHRRQVRDEAKKLEADPEALGELVGRECGGETSGSSIRRESHSA
jgi:hypothetical protein